MLNNLFNSVFASETQSTLSVVLFLLGLRGYHDGKRKRRRWRGGGGRVFTGSLPLRAGERKGDFGHLHGNVLGTDRRSRIFRIRPAFQRSDGRTAPSGKRSETATAQEP